MIKRVLLFIYLIEITGQSFGQHLVYEVGKVIYSNSRDSAQSKFLHNVAVRCNQFIQEYYPKQDSISVRLNITWTADTTFYQLGYDNLAGNFIETTDTKLYGNKVSNSIATKAAKYPGIRIGISSKTIHEEDIFKLLEYGLLHFSELKGQVLQAIRQDYFSRPAQVALHAQTVDAILHTPTSDRIKEILDTAYLRPEETIVPKTINEAVLEMIAQMDKSEKDILKSLDEGSVIHELLYGNHDPFFYVNWHLANRDESPLVSFFAEHKITDGYDAYEILLRLCHRQLNSYPLRIDDIIETIAKRRERYNEEYSFRMKADTLNGIYIPKDLPDCFMQLDKLLSTEDRRKIKEFINREVAGKECYAALGSWMKNKWGLLKGSRLQQYFLDNNITYPESMSVVILEFYYDWLKGENTYTGITTKGK
jgi:hypothetical protein